MSVWCQNCYSQKQERISVTVINHMLINRAAFGQSELKGYVPALLFTILLLLIFPGCASVKDAVEPPGASRGHITVFLTGAEKISANIAFELASIGITAEDGTHREIMGTPVAVDSKDLAGRQVLLSEVYLPEGMYKKLHMEVREAVLKGPDRVARLALPADGIVIDADLRVLRGQSSSLFITWDADASVSDGYLFSPALSVKGQAPELSSLLIYVTNEDSNTVSVIHKQTGENVATIMVGSKPRGIAVSTDRNAPKVYVVNSGSNSISVIDPTIHKVEVEIPVRFGRNPEGIAVFSAPSGRELIFVTNYGSDNVSVIDGATYREMEKISVGDGPVAVAVDPPAENISASRFLSFDDVTLLRRYRERFFNVYVANKHSKDVSVIRMDGERNTADRVFSVPVQWSPIALEVDYPRGRVYVANFDYDDLSVVHILQIVRENMPGAVTSITNVGNSVTGIAADPEFDRLYLVKESTGEIIVIRPFSEAMGPRAVMSPMVGAVRVGNSPRSVMPDPEGRKLYVVNRESNTVSVVDKTTLREEKVIPVGRKPYGIAMFPF